MALKFYTYDGCEVPYTNETELVNAYRHPDTKYMKSDSEDDFNKLREAIEKETAFHSHIFIPIDTDNYCGIFVWDSERKGWYHHHDYINYYKGKVDVMIEDIVSVIELTKEKNKNEDMVFN